MKKEREFVQDKLEVSPSKTYLNPADVTVAPWRKHPRLFIPFQNTEPLRQVPGWRDETEEET